jgi:hypothetical protein
VTRYFWHAFQALWKVCNTDLHGTTYAGSEPTRQARILPVITYLYNHVHELAPSNRVMLQLPLAERILQPTSVLTSWLSVVHPAFEAAHIPDEADSDHEDAFTEAQEIEQALEADHDSDS